MLAVIQVCRGGAADRRRPLVGRDRLADPAASSRGTGELRDAGSRRGAGRCAARRCSSPRSWWPARSRWGGTGSRSRRQPSSPDGRAAARRSGCSRRSLAAAGAVVPPAFAGVVAGELVAASASGWRPCSRWSACSSCGRFAPAERTVRACASSSGSTSSTRSAAGPARTGSAGARRRTRRTSSRPGGCARPGSRSTSIRPGTSSGGCAGAAAEVAEVWTGSHLDTVPAGGRFDGALGVVAGLEAVERTRAAGADAGRRCVSRRGGLSRARVRGSRALCDGWLEPKPAAFLEAHIEQGPRLEQAGAPLARRDGDRRDGARRGRVRGRGRPCRARRRWRAGEMRSAAAAEFVLLAPRRGGRGRRSGGDGRARSRSSRARRT